MKANILFPVGLWGMVVSVLSLPMTLSLVVFLVSVGVACVGACLTVSRDTSDTD